jgi:hypothetical protein
MRCVSIRNADYAVVTFPSALDGVDAKAFFEHLGTIDAALFSGQFAGFTQIAFQGSPLNNSMLFLKPAASKNRWIAGLSAAANTTPGAVYFPLKKNAEPTTARAGIAFPGNDWIAFPHGEEYLSRLGTPSAQLLADLAALQQAHLDASRRSGAGRPERQAVAVSRPSIQVSDRGMTRGIDLRRSAGCRPCDAMAACRPQCKSATAQEHA